MLPLARRSIQPAAFALLCMTGIAVSVFALGPGLRIFLPHGLSDFMDLYAGGKLAFSHHLYNAPHVMKVELATEGWYSPTRLFMRPPVFAAFFWPLAQLPYRIASTVWEVLCVAAFAGFVVLWPSRRRWGAALACCWSLPALMTVAQGQDIGFLLLLVALATRLLGKNHPAGAGAVLSLCAAKFHLFLLLPVWIVASRAWRLASGLCAGGAVLILLSFAANGADWPVRYYRLVSNPASNPYPAAMPNLHGLVAGWPHPELFEIAGIALVASLVWFAGHHRNTECGLAAALAGGILAAPHAYVADCALLIPAVLIVLENTGRGWTRGLCVFLLTPIPCLFLLLEISFYLQALLLMFLLAIARPGTKKWETGGIKRPPALPALA